MYKIAFGVLLAGSLFAMDAGAQSLRDRLCDPSFGRVGRTLPTWCTGRSVISSTPPTVQPNAYPTTVTRTNRTYSRYVPTYYRRTTGTSTATTTPRVTAQFTQGGVLQNITNGQTLMEADVNLSLPKPYRSTTFTEAVRVTSMKFSMTSQNAGAVDYRDFQLNMMGDIVPFDSTGTAVVYVDQRLTAGNSITNRVELMPADYGGIGSYRGSFQLRLDQVSGQREQSRLPVLFDARSNMTSEAFAFTAGPTTQTGNEIEIRSEQAFDATITANTTIDALGLRITPQFADVRLDAVKLHNVLGNGQTSSYIQTATLIDDDTEQVLDTASFVGDTVTFYPTRAQEEFPINQTRRLRVELEMQDDVPSTVGLRLVATASDFDFQSLISGRDILTSQMDVQLDPATFSLTNATLSIFHGAVQPRPFAVTGTPQNVYQFQVQNPSTDDVYLSRFSFLIQLDDLNYGDYAKTTDDFQLVQRASNGQTYATNFRPTLTSTGVRFDATSPVIIGRGRTVDYTLKLALEKPLTGSQGNEAVTVYWEEDAAAQFGTLSALQSTGAKIIWSDDNRQQVWQAGPGIETPAGALVIQR